MDLESLSPLRWGRILGTLSLDVCRPYLDRMGLAWPDPDALVEVLREVILHHRARASRGDVSPPLFHVDALGAVSRRFGDAWGEHLARWGEEVYQHGGSRGMPVFLWTSVLKAGGLDGARDTTAPPSAVTALRQALLARPPIKARQLLPTSAWDHEIFSRARYDEFDNPLEDIEGTVRHVDLLAAWAQVSPGLDTQARQALDAWALEEATRRGMPAARLLPAGTWEGLPPPPSGSDAPEGIPPTAGGEA